MNRILNPATGRMVKADGRIGRRLIKTGAATLQAAQPRSATIFLDLPEVAYQRIAELLSEDCVRDAINFWTACKRTQASVFFTDAVRVSHCPEMALLKCRGDWRINSTGWDEYAEYEENQHTLTVGFTFKCRGVRVHGYYEFLYLTPTVVSKEGVSFDFGEEGQLYFRVDAILLIYEGDGEYIYYFKEAGRKKDPRVAALVKKYGAICLRTMIAIEEAVLLEGKHLRPKIRLGSSGWMDVAKDIQYPVWFDKSDVTLLGVAEQILGRAFVERVKANVLTAF